MKKLLAYFAFFLYAASSHAINLNDPAVKKFIADKGWMYVDINKKALLEKANIFPVAFNSKGSVATSCGLIHKTDNNVNFIEVLIAELGDPFPQCGGFNDAANFKMFGTDYFVYVYLDRDLRDTTYEEFFFLRQDNNLNLIVEKHLNDLDKPTERPKKLIKRSLPNNTLYTAKIKDGIALAKASLMQDFFLKEIPSYHFSLEDFISDANNSFAIFKDPAKGSCVYIIENLGETQLIKNPNCRKFLAAGSLEKNGKLYFIAIYKDNTQNQKIDLISIDLTRNSIAPEPQLATRLESINKNMDIKTVKRYLSE